MNGVFSSVLSDSRSLRGEKPQFVQHQLDYIRRSLCGGRHGLKISIRV